MKITRDHEVERILFDSIRENWKNLLPRTKIHVSDLGWPRQSYWRRTLPKSATRNEIMYWMTGLGHELVFRHASGYRRDTTGIEWEGIMYAADFYQPMNTVEAVPVDLKTRRGFVPRPGTEAEAYKGYISGSILPYCAIMERNIGCLQVWFLSTKQADGTTIPVFHSFRCEFTDAELEEERDRLRRMRDLFALALSGKDHLILPLCPDWACGKKAYIMTNSPECHTCGGTDAPGTRKRKFTKIHILNKHLREFPDHKIDKPEFSGKYLWKCKWFPECRGPEFMRKCIPYFKMPDDREIEAKDITGKEGDDGA